MDAHVAQQLALEQVQPVPTTRIDLDPHRRALLISNREHVHRGVGRKDDAQHQASQPRETGSHPDRPQSVGHAAKGDKRGGQCPDPGADHDGRCQCPAATHPRGRLDRAQRLQVELTDFPTDRKQPHPQVRQVHYQTRRRTCQTRLVPRCQGTHGQLLGVDLGARVRDGPSLAGRTGGAEALASRGGTHITGFHVVEGWRRGQGSRSRGLSWCGLSPCPWQLTPP